MKGAMIARSPADGQGKDAAANPGNVALQTVIGDVDELLGLLGLSRATIVDDRRRAGLSRCASRAPSSPACSRAAPTIRCCARCCR
jgi:hypothetical protein